MFFVLVNLKAFALLLTLVFMLTIYLLKLYAYGCILSIGALFFCFFFVICWFCSAVLEC